MLKTCYHAISHVPSHARLARPMCVLQLFPPTDAQILSSSSIGEPCWATVILKTFDRFGNAMSKGGLPVAVRMQLIKSGVHDLTTLMPNNHATEIEDKEDGTYHVKVMLIKIAASVKVIVNMDKNIPAGGGELPAVQITFINPETATDGAALDEDMLDDDNSFSKEKMREAGSEVTETVHASAP